jgi:hypothetical protein
MGSISRKGGKNMKRFTGLPVLWGAALIFGACALPLGEDYLITRDGSANITYIAGYNLQSYVPIPRTGDRPITLVDRPDLDITVVWKDRAGAAIPLPFDEFLPDTEYQADIHIMVKAGYGFYASTPFGYPDGKVRSQNDDLGDPGRIVTVAYNNSDDADITFVTDYNLQRYVPVPLAGERPVGSVTSRLDLTIDAQWKVEDPPDSGTFVPIPGDGYTFDLGRVYQADIELRANSGCRFSVDRDFEYPPGTVQVQPNRDRDPGARALTTVTYQPTRAAAVINDLNLTSYIPRPLSGVTALTAFVGLQYTGTVIWKNTKTQEALAGHFQAGEEYTAEVSLYPAMGYTFTGVGQDEFFHTGAARCGNSADSGAVRVEFAAIPSSGGPALVYDTDLTGRIPRPTHGETPVRNITTPQYAGTVTWVPSPHSTFQYAAVYRAVLTLNAAPGYTFAGLEQNAFTHNAAPGAVVNAAGSGTVTITFPPTASATYTAIASFGPADREGSALKLMKEKRADNSLTIDLPVGDTPEPVAPNGAALTAGINSPPKVVINGHGRVLRIEDAGTLLTVGSGVTLTLRDITFQGYSPNTAPLVRVDHGGKLILGSGVIFTGNESDGDTGGVWVNGGELVMNTGSAITGMEAQQGGGVLVDGYGTFTMNSGTIGGPGSGNTACGVNGGGGVLVADGSFHLLGGLIQSNRALAARSGGGVAVLRKGTFDMFGGTIKGNSAPWSTPGADLESGGAVFIAGVDDYENQQGSFIMYGGTIGGEDPGDANEAAIGANGVCVVFGDFALSGGTIKGNRFGPNDYGVYFRRGTSYYARGNFTMTGAAQVHENNRVFLYSDATIFIDSALSASPYAANIIMDSPAENTRLLRANSEDLITVNYHKFLYDGASGHIKDTSVYTYDPFIYNYFYFGVYQP